MTDAKQRHFIELCEKAEQRTITAAERREMESLTDELRAEDEEEIARRATSRAMSEAYGPDVDAAGRYNY